MEKVMKKSVLIIFIVIICFIIFGSIFDKNTKTSESNEDTKYTTTTTTNKNTSKVCGYKYSNGTTCGKAVGSHAPLCDYHFYQLDSIYTDLVGK